MRKLFLTVGSFVLILSAPAVLQAVEAALDTGGQGGAVTRPSEENQQASGVKMAPGVANQGLLGGGAPPPANMGPPPGSLDPAFNTNGFNGSGKYIWTSGPNENDMAEAVAIDSQGRAIVAGCVYPTSSPLASLYVTRFTTIGIIDLTFGIPSTPGYTRLDGSICPTAMVIDSGQRIVMTGYFFNPTTQTKYVFVGRLTEEGNWDQSFNVSGNEVLKIGTGDDQGMALAIGQDGDIVVAASTQQNNGASTDFAVIRFNPEGSLDPSFGNNHSGITTTHFVDPNNSNTYSVPRTVVIGQLPSPEIFVAGASTANSAQKTIHFAVASYTPSGTPNKNFGPLHDGTVVQAMVSSSEEMATDIKIDPDNTMNQGLLYITGCSEPTYLETMQVGMASGIPVQSGNSLVPINFYSPGSSAYQCNGVTFEKNGGKQMMFGTYTDNNGTNKAFVALGAIGQNSLNQTFGNEGLSGAQLQTDTNAAFAAAMQSDGKIILVGSGREQPTPNIPSPTSNFAVARFIGVGP